MREISFSAILRKVTTARQSTSQDEGRELRAEEETGAMRSPEVLAKREVPTARLNEPRYSSEETFEEKSLG